MNPYLEILKKKKGVPPLLPKLTEAPFVSSVSGGGRTVSETDTPSGSSVSDMNAPFRKIDLVHEFMEVDGLTLEEAEALAAVSVMPRPAAEWIAMIQELDALIDRYCHVCRLSEDARLRIRSIRLSQSLASIPVALVWFRRELDSKG